MKTLPTFSATALAACALLAPPDLAAAPPVAAPVKADAPTKQDSRDTRVTSAGFEDLAYASTFYVEVPMIGMFGQEVTAEGIQNALRMAAENPHIHHVVLMIDSNAREGSLLDDKVVGVHQDRLEVHTVIHDATVLATFPVFFCDSIFITEGGHIGGLPLHRYVPQGSEEVIAKMVGIYANQLASAAEQHGHNPDIVRAMIDQNKSIHYWRERGVIHVSNTAPDSTFSVDDYEHITSHISGETITLDYDQAVKLELAYPIEEFDAVWVGDQIGVDRWEPANRYGLIANQIGRITGNLTPLQEQLAQINRSLPDIQITRENRNDPNLRDLQDAKRAFSSGVDAIDKINEALGELYLIHPERHPYFPGEEGETILQDPDQWRADVEVSQQYIAQAKAGMSTLRNAFDRLNADPAQLDDLVDALDTVEQHLDGIQEHGNVHYWENVYEEPLPEDEYGVTYG